MRKSKSCWIAIIAGILALGLLAGSGAGAEPSGKEIYQRTLRSTCWVLTPVDKNRAMSGTGWIVDLGRSLIITNQHVVGSQGASVYVFFPAYESGKLITDREYYKKATPVKGQVVHRDAGRDLALIRVESIPRDANQMKLASESVGPGDRVHTVGNPGVSKALWVYTSGTVRTEPYSYKNKIQEQKIDARVFDTQSPINPGDSGGPVVNDKGELVGVNFAHTLNSQQITHCIHLDEVKEVMIRGLGMLNLPSTSGTDKFTLALRLREQGIAAMRKGDYATAIDLFSSAIRIDPAEHLNYNERGAAYTYLDKDAEAIKDFSKVIALNPKHHVAYRNRGAAQFRLGKTQEAINDFTKAIQLNDRYARAFRGRGDAYTKLGKSKEAQEDYKKAIELGTRFQVE